MNFRRQTILAGIAFGAITSVADIAVMLLTMPSPSSNQTAPGDIGTQCVNLIVTMIFYTVCGYMAAGLTRDVSQGLRAGGIAGIVTSIIDSLAITALGIVPLSVGDIIAQLIFIAVLNVPIGLALGYVGGTYSAPRNAA